MTPKTILLMFSEKDTLENKFSEKGVKLDFVSVFISQKREQKTGSEK